MAIDQTTVGRSSFLQRSLDTAADAVQLYFRPIRWLFRRKKRRSGHPTLAADERGQHDNISSQFLRFFAYPLNPSSADARRFSRLVVPLVIQDPETGTRLTNQATVDTGSECTIISCDLGRAIGFSFSGEGDVEIRYSFGQPVPGFSRKVLFRIESEGHFIEWQSTVVFVESDLPRITLGLTGALEFFNLSLELPYFQLTPRPQTFPGEYSLGNVRVRSAVERE